ncbi:hypothetical protein LOTGIDRAFT_157859 [Lottia gigantea]|uniref:Peroxisomal biogenesis factor 3 n=1 Tax=Lottia gigantea TaxID=225164 RepID=V4AZM7_LOTGI|nr:hypothetical protein LOTGIDRAFT_157859 [Lottia gigantea]ESP00581.1 hypothetical protein LOTGIDRAFT_157859 [Lottia gigantea]
MVLGMMWNFIKRHKKKFVFSGILFGGSWLMYKYLVKRVKELKEEEEQEYINLVRRQHHFESNQKTCNMTVISMIPNIRDILLSRLNTEEYTSQLKNQPANKLELWSLLKTNSFARTISSVYGCCLMSLILRVQLNIIGGYIFLDSSQTSENSRVQHQTSKSVQERYLSLIKHFVGPGFEELINRIVKCTSKELDSVALREELTLSNVEAVIQHVRGRIDDTLNSALPLSSYLLPSECFTDIVKTPDEELYEKLVTETRDVLDSDDFKMVLATCLNQGFSKIFDFLADHYKKQSNSKTDIHEVKIPMAKIIPFVNGLVFKILHGNNFIQELLLLEDVKKLAGNIYESFCNVH